eukprot:GILJ01005208.1.p1 GENE.GILJ01005208.1~~GILJ01005208.1.p1  ORF type:complete len:534 (+),score=82.44 GILJ01005208.1:121-1722(+)
MDKPSTTMRLTPQSIQRELSAMSGHQQGNHLLMPDGTDYSPQTVQRLLSQNSPAPFPKYYSHNSISSLPQSPALSPYGVSPHFSPLTTPNMTPVSPPMKQWPPVPETSNRKPPVVPTTNRAKVISSFARLREEDTSIRSAFSKVKNDAAPPSYGVVPMQTELAPGSPGPSLPSILDSDKMYMQPKMVSLPSLSQMNLPQPSPLSKPSPLGSPALPPQSMMSGALQAPSPELISRSVQLMMMQHLTMQNVHLTERLKQQKQQIDFLLHSPDQQARGSPLTSDPMVAAAMNSLRPMAGSMVSPDSMNMSGMWATSPLMSPDGSLPTTLPPPKSKDPLSPLLVPGQSPGGSPNIRKDHRIGISSLLADDRLYTETERLSRMQIHSPPTNPSGIVELSPSLSPYSMVGAYTTEERKARIARYQEKRRKWRSEHPINRQFRGRKAVAESKPRIKGRFVKKTEFQAYLDANGGKMPDSDSEESSPSNSPPLRPNSMFSMSSSNQDIPQHHMNALNHHLMKNHINNQTVSFAANASPAQR